ncbi:MAG: hypothetical protein AVDCRST_MAG83-1623 [uncultured Arthrobacter sp.]|uniref:Uncharacterized protein n=1 Tax=uncultured Arthrobacter sp. TaxID=114050 RepID=A0A6J4I3B0_9MICC|nr:MAG: hypothetical protein AVDCRST_MAG83-1623 [uncultured Arthrobacter sp.]
MGAHQPSGLKEGHNMGSNLEMSGGQLVQQVRPPGIPPGPREPA